MSDPRTSPLSAPVLGRALAIFLPAALLTGAVVYALYLQDRGHERTLHEQASRYLVELQADILNRELRAIESDLQYLADQAVLRNYLAGAAGSRQELEAEYLLFSRQKGVYDQVRYLDATGQERVRVNYNSGRPVVVPKSELQLKADRYYFTQTIQFRRGEVFFSRLDLNVERGEIERPFKPMIRCATPVFDSQGAKRGIVILNYLGDALRERLAEAAGAFAGSAFLLNSDGYFLRGPTREDEWGFMLGRDRRLATLYPEEWAPIAQEKQGQFATPHGLFTFRALRPPTPQILSPHETWNDPDAGDAGLIVVAFVPADVLDGRATRFLHRVLLLWALALTLLLALAWFLGYAGAVRRRHERQLADSADRLRTLSAQLLAAQEAERRSLARDLHDELGQVVTALTLDLERAAQAGEAARKDDLIGRALHAASCLLDSLHAIATRLRPPMLDDLGLRDAVQVLLADYERRTGIAVRAELRFEDSRIPAAIQENVYRILQEALTNVAKHAKASQAQVSLHAGQEAVTLTVRDAGVGFDPVTVDNQRLGLLGIRERAELLGGTFALAAAPGQGTEVRVTIPLPEGR